MAHIKLAQLGGENLVLGTRNPNLVVAPAEADRARVRDRPLVSDAESPPLWGVMAAHGGAGASTLARWWPTAADTDAAWPGDPDTTQLVVLAARDCMPGLVAAATRLREWHAQLAPNGVVVVGLVLSAVRPGRVPDAVRRYRDIVAPLVAGAVYRIGWHDDLVMLEHGEIAACDASPPRLPPRRRPGLAIAAPRDASHVAAQLTKSIAALRKTGLLRQL